MATAVRHVKHKCGHTEDRDLSFKIPGDRDSFAQWLSGQPCRGCDPKEKKRREQFKATKRAEEAAHALAEEQRFQLEPLTSGTTKMIDWATRVRTELVAAAFEELDLDENDFAEQIAEPASRVDSARWWIDNREIPAAELGTALAAALHDPDLETGNENPF